MTNEGEQKQSFKFVRDLGAGNFGICKLMIDGRDSEQVAVKFLARGPKIDKNVEREILIHSELQHANVIGFKSVFLTRQYLGIVMEYAAGGELFERVKSAGHFTEDEARYFFQQLIAGVKYCHDTGVMHRDLKLENTLLDGSPAPLLKIADFGYSKSENLHTPPKSTVGTPAYISPEVLRGDHGYDGKAADVWSCGVHLYVMLVGAYPFDDPRDPRNYITTMQNIKMGRYAFPRNLPLSPECVDLIRRILVPNSAHRITIAQILQHPWYKMNLPYELQDDCKALPRYKKCTQPRAEIEEIIRAARHVG